MQSDRMKITNVEVLVLKSPGLYNNPEGSEEPLGPTYMGIVRVTTDAGITGYSDMETAASVAKAAVEAPRWSEEGVEAFDGLASLIVGQNPLEVERLWYRMYRGSIYYGRRGVAIQAISAIDIALWDIMGKAFNQPVCVLLGAKWRERVRAYGSTLLRPTPAAMREAVDTRIACGEQEATDYGFQTLIERGRVDVLQPDLTRCGGFTVARKIVHMADRANRLVIPHSWSSDLLTAASLHLIAFQRRAAFVEFSTSQGPLSRLLVKDPLRLEDGFVRIPEGPGLGVEVNDAVINEYRVAS